jgi:seryl-tRNA synthetase
MDYAELLAAHDGLQAKNEKLLQQIEVMKASTNEMQGLLETASAKLDEAAKVQAQLVTALKDALNNLPTNGDCAQFIRHTLAAAGVTT